MCAPAPSTTVRNIDLSRHHSAQPHVPGSPGNARPQTTNQHVSPRDLLRANPLTYLQNLHIPKVPLRKPRPRDNTQLLPQPPKLPRAIRNRNNSLLYRTARHILAPKQQLRSIQLLRTANAKHRSLLRALLMSLMYQREVAEFFREGVGAVWQRHVGY